jgi:hypothetical protein
MLVRDTGIEPVTSSVSGKRSPAELIALGIEIGGGDGNRIRQYLPLKRWSAYLAQDSGTHRVHAFRTHLLRYLVQLVRIQVPVVVQRHGGRLVP